MRRMGHKEVGRVDRRLRRAVLDRLAAIEDMALRAGSHLPVRVARSQLKTITGGWRELLEKHQPDRKGRCPVCSGWLRRRRWPCQVWMTAHEHLIGDKPQQAKWLVKKSNPFSGPRQVKVIPRQVGVPTAADGTAAHIEMHHAEMHHAAEKVVLPRLHQVQHSPD